MADEQRLRLSLAHKGQGLGRKLSEDTRKRMSVAQRGHPVSQEQRLAISRTLKGRRMPYVAEANSKRVYSQVVRDKRRKVARSLWTPQFRQKMKERMSGENSPVWIKDRSKLKIDAIQRPYDTQYKYWMLEVKKRDGWMCRVSNQDCSGRLEAHHILPWRDYPNLRYSLNNGITLCHFHHPKGREEEELVKPFLQGMVNPETQKLNTGTISQYPIFKSS